MHLSLLTFAGVLSTATAVLMPTPTGRYGVGVREYMLEKDTPNDPTAKFGGGKEILVSVYYPTAARTDKRQQYFDPTTAQIYEKAWGFPNDSLETLQTLLQPEAPFLDTDCNLPTIIFSPGGGVNGYMYYEIVGNLASIGYPVVVIDHPGENPATQLPNGTTIIGLNINFAWGLKIAQEIYTFRVSDMVAVVEDFPNFVQRTSAPFNTTYYLSLGHSIGGAAAAGGLEPINALMGGINLDGSFWKPFEDVGKPVFMMLDSNETFGVDPTLPRFFKLQTGWYEVVSVYDTYHLDFSDITTWAPVLGLEHKVETPLDGSIGKKRCREIILEYATSFFRFVAGTGSDSIFHHPSLEWHEVTYVHGSFFNSIWNE